MTISTTGSARLLTRGLSRSFGATQALTGVDLDFSAGEVHAVVGANGAGKSTAMKILAGVLSPNQGKMFLNDKSYQPANPHEARMLGVSTVFQEGALAHHLTVLDNIFLGSEVTGLGGFVRQGPMRAQAERALARLGRQLPLTAMVGDLSVSDRQLVEIARALVIDPQVLILDEPTSSLGTDDRAQLLKVVRGLAAEGMCVVYITHFMDEIKSVSDRYTILRDGQVTGTGLTKTVDVPDIVELMLGRTLTELYPRSAHVLGSPLLALDKLSARRVRTASLTLHKGQVIGVFGLVGSGRTELLETIFGLQEVRSGSIKFGTNFHLPNPSLGWRQGMGFVSEDRSIGLWGNLSIAHNLTISNHTMGGRLGLITGRGSQLRARQWIERLGIKCDHAGEPVGNLSGGNQQKVALARLLEATCDLWVLDEPTRGIDMGARAQVYRLIDEAATSGGAVIVSSSSAEELLGICDMVAVMHRGELLDACPVNELSEHRLVTLATTGSQN